MSATRRSARRSASASSHPLLLPVLLETVPPATMVDSQAPLASGSRKPKPPGASQPEGPAPQLPSLLLSLRYTTRSADFGGSPLVGAGQNVVPFAVSCDHSHREKVRPSPRTVRGGPQATRAHA